MRRLILLTLLFASSAHGVLHSYDFEIGSGETGSFSYDDGGQVGQVLGLGFSSFDFDFMSESYSAADMLFGSVWLNADGTLDDSMAGFWCSNGAVGSCTVLSQTAQAGSTDIQFKFFGMNLPGYGTQNFSHGFGLLNETSTLSLTYAGIVDPSETTSVSEPPTLLMLGALALLLCRVRYKTTLRTESL